MKNMDKSYNILFKIKKKLSVPAYYLFGEYKRNIKTLESLKNKYEGERCFVVCNGPSLTPEDLNKIHDSGDISFGINNIARIYDKTPWRPTFLSITDDVAFMNKNIHICKNCEADYKFFDKKRYACTLNFKAKNRFYLDFNESKTLLEEPFFNPDATLPMPSIGTSTYVVLEMAVFMGFHNIYLIGNDMSYSVNITRDGNIYYNKAGKDHFYPASDDVVKMSNEKPCPTWQLEVAFDTAQKYAKAHGVNIFNATRGGMCESFERVNFDELF